MANKNDVILAAHEAGLNVRTCSPGDGVTRYRFFPKDDPSSYFGPSNGIHTVLGAKAALAYCAGVRNGEEVNVKYKIVRMYYGDRPSHIVKRNLSLAEAQAHCSDPKTRKVGEWFDCFDRM